MKELAELSDESLSLLLKFIVSPKNSNQVNGLLKLSAEGSSSIYLDTNKYEEIYQKNRVHTINEIVNDLTKCQAIKNVNFFSKLSIDEINKFSHELAWQEIIVNEYIYNVNDSSLSCYVLISGEIILTQDFHSANSIKLTQSYQMFGIEDMINQNNRSHDAISCSSCKLLIIPNDVFLSLISNRKTEKDEIIKECMSIMKFEAANNISHSTRMDANNNRIHILINSDKKYLKLSDNAYYIWTLIDGQRNLNEIAAIYCEKTHSNPNEIICEIRNLLFKLIKLKFIKINSVLTADKIHSKHITFQVASYLKNVFTYQYQICNINEKLDFINRRVGHIIFSITALFSYFSIAILGTIIFCYITPVYFKSLTNESHILLYYLIAYLIVTLTIPLHELAHAMTTKYYGRNIGSIGVGWLWIGPIAFVDTTDMWLCDKRKRIIVNIAGICLNYILGSAAAVIAYFCGTSPLGFVLLIFAFMSYLVVFFNLNPYLEFDGYYLLVDLLDCSNLRSKSIHWLVKDFRTTFKDINKIILYKNEIIYWIVCVLYAVASFFILYTIQNYFLSNILHIHASGYSFEIARIIIPVFLIILSFYTAFITYEK